MENVITLGKLIGLLFCSLSPLYFVFENSKNTRNELARPVMGTIFTPHWTKKIFESYFRDRLTFSTIRSRTSRRIYRLALPLHAPEMLSSLSKSRISIFNAHLTLFVRRMMLHNSIGKYRHLV